METLDAESILQNPAISHLAPILRPLQRNSIRLYPKAADVEPALGASKLGGRPDLPADMEWPSLLYQIPPQRAEFIAAKGIHLVTPHPTGVQSMPFLGQLRCDELALFDRDHLLPKTGLLYFFFFDEWYEVEVPADYVQIQGGLMYDKVHNIRSVLAGPPWHSRVRVLYTEDTEKLISRDFPSNLPTQLFSTHYRPCRLAFGNEMTLPRGEDGWIGLGEWDPAPHALNEEEARTYGDLFYEWRSKQNEICQILGHPDMFSHGPGTPLDLFPEDSNAQLPFPQRRIEAAQNRRLLLQLNLGIETVTDISFSRDFLIFIREQDLRRRDFTRVWWDMS